MYPDVWHESRSFITCQHSSRFLVTFVLLFHSIPFPSPLMATSDNPQIPSGTDSNVQPRASPVRPVNPPDASSSETFPDPLVSPKEFTSYLIGIANPDLIGTWEHLQRRPLQVCGSNHLDNEEVNTWSEKMYTMVVCLFYI